MKLPNLIIKDKGLKEVNLKIESNCPVVYLEKLQNFVCQNTGQFNASQLARYTNIPEHYFQMGKTLSVTSLTDFINQNYDQEKNKSFIGSNFIGPQKYITASNRHQIKVVCDACKSGTGEKNIKLVRSGNSQNPNDVWLKTTLAFEVEAFFPTKMLHPSLEKLNRRSFVKKKTKTVNPGSLITDVSKIKFLQLRKVLDPSKPIARNDFISHNLVTAGKHAKVVFKSDGISLSLKALPLGYGKFGDIVQLRNPKSKQIISGRVIDFNTVLVEL